MSCYVIVPAAGWSTRMGSTTSGSARKQLLVFHGAPVVVHTLRKLDRCAELGPFLVPARPEDGPALAARVAAESFTHPVEVLEGGETRQESVWRALQRVPAEAEFVLIHDAVRPFVEPETVARAVAAVRHHGAVIAAVPAVDTIKQVERGGAEENRVVATLPRERLVLAQTPQVFRHDWLRAAFEQALAEGFQATDESALLEHAGREVYAVAGSSRNWKITTPADLELAEMFLARP